MSEEARMSPWTLVVLTAAVSALLFLLVPGGSARAQFVLPGIETAVSIVLSPAYPSPGDSVRIEARSSAYDLSESFLTWKVNGKTVAEGRGVSMPNIIAGALGSEIDLSLSAIASDGTESLAYSAIIPTEVDLLFDSDSYVPPFYRGRALASPGTMIRLEAIPHFLRGGKELAASDLMYTWRKNDGALANVSGRGRSSISTPSSVFSDTDVISVEVSTEDGTLGGSASIIVPSAEPVLALYQDHPLYGTLYHRALGAEVSIPDTEMTFAAVPYFGEARSPDDPLLRYAWSVNDTEVKADSTRPSKLTINAQNSEGLALVRLEILHAANAFLDAIGAWSIRLRSGGAVDPFSGQ